MENHKILISHLKSKSINKNLTLNDIASNNKIINDYIQEPSTLLTDSNNLKSSINSNYNYQKRNNSKNDEISISLDFRNTFDDINQNVLDIYYDKSSDFKNKIDGLNLQFYLETEKYLNCNNKNDFIRSQKLQANLFIILFKQINIFIEEIERLNKLIIENKYKNGTILKRTNEIKEKKNNIIIKDTYVQSLKQTKTNIEKKLLESLLHEDKLMKDNERLRKENETYKTLTIMFQNEINNNKKRKNGSFSPLHKKNIRHIKTNSDYGIPSISTIWDISRTNTGRYGNIYNDSKLTLSNEKVINTNYNRDNVEELYNNKNNSKSKNIYDKNRMKNKVKKIKKNIKNNNIKINKYNQLLRHNTLKESIKFKLKPTFNPGKNNKINHEIKNEKKKKIKNDFPSLNKFVKSKSKNIQIKNYEVNYNFKINNSCNNKKPINSEKVTKRKNMATNFNNNLNFNKSNTSSHTNTIMIEANNNYSFEKIKALNGGKVNIRNSQNKRNTSDKSFTGTVRVEILNEELNNLLNNQINHLYTQTINKPKGTNYKIKKSFSHKFDLKKNNKIEKIISIQD